MLRFFSDSIIALRHDGGAGVHRGMTELQYAVCIRVFCMWFWPEVRSADFILTDRICVGKGIHQEMQQKILSELIVCLCVTDLKCVHSSISSNIIGECGLSDILLNTIQIN